MEIMFNKVMRCPQVCGQVSDVSCTGPGIAIWALLVAEKVWGCTMALWMDTRFWVHETSITKPRSKKVPAEAWEDFQPKGTAALSPSAGDDLRQIAQFGFGGDLHRVTHMKSLVVGRQSGAPAIYLAEQLRGSPGHVTYVDSCVESIQKLEKEAQSRSLKNIRWFLARDPAELADLPIGPYDYIRLHDVLYRDDQGETLLNTLKGLLTTDGALNLLYYEPRPTMQKSGYLETWVMGAAKSLVHKRTDTDATLAHTTPQELLALLKHAQCMGFSPEDFASWLKPRQLHRLYELPDDENIAPTGKDKTKASDPQTFGHLSHLLQQVVHRKRVYISKEEKPFLSAQNIDLVPSFANIDGHNLKHQFHNRRHGQVTLSTHRGTMQLDLKPSHHRLLHHLDGNKTLGDILVATQDELLEPTLGTRQLLGHWQELYDFLHPMGCLYLRKLDPQNGKRPSQSPSIEYLH
jgi:hypothetical protein